MSSGDLTGKVSATPSFPAADFDGVDDYIEIPHSIRQLGATLSGGFTISAWINPRNLGEGSVGRILDKSTNTTATAGFYFRLVSVDKLQFRINAGTAVSSAASSIVYNTWTHVLVTVSAAQLTNFYVNGVQNGTANSDLVQPISAITTTNVMRIGNDASGTSQTFDGMIRAVRMWNRVLTAAEITSDATGKIVSDGLLMNYELNGNANDSSQFANDGTASGAYFTSIPFNNIVADVRQRNLATVTDKLFVLPVMGRNSMFNVVSANRTP